MDALLLKGWAADSHAAPSSTDGSAPNYSGPHVQRRAELFKCECAAARSAVPALMLRQCGMLNAAYEQSLLCICSQHRSQPRMDSFQKCTTHTLSYVSALANSYLCSQCMRECRLPHLAPRPYHTLPTVVRWCRSHEQLTPHQEALFWQPAGSAWTVMLRRFCVDRCQPSQLKHYSPAASVAYDNVSPQDASNVHHHQPQLVRHKPYNMLAPSTAIVLRTRMHGDSQHGTNKHEILLLRC
jgi:hypothetical protein